MSLIKEEVVTVPLEEILSDINRDSIIKISRGVYVLKYQGKCYQLNPEDVLRDGESMQDIEHRRANGNDFLNIAGKYRLNELDAIFLTILCNKELFPDFDKDTVLNDISKFSCQWYSPQAEICRGRFKRYNTRLKKYLKVELFQKLLNSDSFNLDCYINFIFSKRYVERMRLDSKMLENTVNIDFKNMTLSFDMINGMYDNAILRVKYDLKETLSGTGSMGTTVNYIHNNLVSLYTAHIKNTSGVQVPSEDRYILSRLLVQLDMWSNLNTSIIETLQKEGFTDATFYQSNVKDNDVSEIDIKYSLLLMDKVYKYMVTLSNKNKIVRDFIRNFSIELSKEVLTKIVEDVITDNTDKINQHKLTYLSLEDDTSYYPYRSDRQDYFLTVVNSIIDDIFTGVNAEYERMLQDILKSKVWNILFDMNKQDFQLLMSKDIFEINNILLARQILDKAGLNIGTKELHFIMKSDLVNMNFQEHTHVYNQNSYISICSKLYNNGYKLSEIIKVIEYIIEDCRIRQGVKVQPESIYYDYIDMSLTLVETGYNTLSSIQLTPYSIKLSHDVTLMDYNTIKTQVDNEKFKKAYKDVSVLDKKEFSLNNKKKLSLIIPEHSDELKTEGKSLNHCVSSYIRRVINNECYILFLRDAENTDKSKYTIELIKVREGRYRIGQTKGINNTEIPTEAKQKLRTLINKYLHPEEQGELAVG